MSDEKQAYLGGDVHVTSVGGDLELTTRARGDIKTNTILLEPRVYAALVHFVAEWQSGRVPPMSDDKVVGWAVRTGNDTWFGGNGSRHERRVSSDRDWSIDIAYRFATWKVVRLTYKKVTKPLEFKVGCFYRLANGMVVVVVREGNGVYVGYALNKIDRWDSTLTGEWAAVARISAKEAQAYARKL